MANQYMLELLSEKPGFLETALDWIDQEWATKDGMSLEERRQRLLSENDQPGAHVMTTKGIPVGVISFTRHQLNDERTEQLWLDVLYVERRFRSNGIGTRLLKAAENLASTFEQQLYVYTDKPEYYERLNWSRSVQLKGDKSVVLVRDVQQLT
jgi:predicted N-acetyltransferase YhbS